MNNNEAKQWQRHLNIWRTEAPDIWRSYIWLGLVAEEAAITGLAAATLWQVSAQEAGRKSSG